jgi:hypothetical protein
MKLGISLLTILSCAASAFALDRPDVTFKVFQFPANMIPRIDGNADDWAMVPDDYAITQDELVDDARRFPKAEPNNLQVKVRFGWVAGMNKLYVLYEAYDNYWEFSDPGLKNDVFELAVDGDASGGPFVGPKSTSVWKPEFVGPQMAVQDSRLNPDAVRYAVQGAHAQNYHIFTPAKDKDWCLSWNSATWVKELPWANCATQYNFKQGESGKLVLECWITPFDYAGAEGPERAVPSKLFENKIIGMSFAIMDFDGDANPNAKSFWNLSRQHTFYGNATQLCAFKLMPLEKQFVKDFEAKWSFKVVDPDRRLVAFKDESSGEVKNWKWTFGDGETSTEQNPVHTFTKAGEMVTILEVEGPSGKSRRSKVYEISVK